MSETANIKPEIQAAQKEANNFLRQFRSVTALAEALDKCGDIWSEISSLRRTLEEEKKQNEELKNEHVSLLSHRTDLLKQTEGLKAEVNDLTERKKATEAYLQDFAEREALLKHVEELKAEVDALTGKKNSVQAKLQNLRMQLS